MNKYSRAEIAQKYQQTRQRTLALFDLTEEKFLRESPGFGFRPIIWHLAHQGAFEEFWILGRIAGHNPISERFQTIFDPIKTPRESSKNLPSKTEMLGYLNEVRARVLEVLGAAVFDSDDPLLQNGYVFELVHQHELQHQETLAYLFHLLPPEKLRRPENGQRVTDNGQRITDKGQRTIAFPESKTIIGAVNQSEFCYDNEIPAHGRFIPAFRLDRFLTTNEEFAEFVAEKGYERREFWSDAGWEFREKENWQQPLCWRRAGSDWRIRAMFEEKTLSELENHPVYGVSFYEAEAYAKFRGKRLPSEFEWERAASFDEENKTRFAVENPSKENCNFAFQFWDSTPVDSFEQANGIFDLNGNLWEWTASDFAPFPGFEAFPYPEYSAEWFDGDHKVLKGGSWATSKEILRASFRNFFRRHFRIAFAGVRLAQSV